MITNMFNFESLSSIIFVDINYPGTLLIAKYPQVTDIFHGDGILILATETSKMQKKIIK